MLWVIWAKQAMRYFQEKDSMLHVKSGLTKRVIDLKVNRVQRPGYTMRY